MTKSASRNGVLPYEIIAAAVRGEPEAMQAVVQHYSGYIAAMSMRTSYDKDGNPHTRVDEDLRWRLERKLIITILDFDLN